MREILIRGKRLDNGEWIEGAHILLDEEEHRIATSCLTNESRELLTVCAYPVDPETVGQYTGLLDKNGAKIFEGDIVKHYTLYFNPDKFETGLIYWEPEEFKFVRTSSIGPINISKDCKYEVIGNQYDNPELLKQID